MKKLLFYSLAFGAIMLASFSNRNSEPVNDEVQNPIILRSSVEATRAGTDLQATQIAAGINVGVFVVDSETTTTIHYTNESLSANGSGGFTGSTSLYYPKNGSVSVYSYAPFQAGWSFDADNTFTVSSDQSTNANYLASDLLYGVPDPNEFDNTTSEAITIPHLHKLAKLTVKFNVEDYTDLTDATINILNTLPTTTLKISDGTLGSASEDPTPIKAHVAKTTKGEDASVIIVPQTILRDTDFIQIVPSGSSEKTLVAKLDNDINFESGKAYTFTVNLKDNRAEVKITSTSVTNWGTGGDLSGDAHEVTQ